MNINPKIKSFESEMIEWRRHLHKNPELGFQEEKTSAFVQDKLLIRGEI